MDSKRPEKRVGFFFGNVCRGKCREQIRLFYETQWYWTSPVFHGYNGAVTIDLGIILPVNGMLPSYSPLFKNLVKIEISLIV
jgi:hypothetical protein